MPNLSSAWAVGSHGNLCTQLVEALTEFACPSSIDGIQHLLDGPLKAWCVTVPVPAKPEPPASSPSASNPGQQQQQQQQRGRGAVVPGTMAKAANGENLVHVVARQMPIWACLLSKLYAVLLVREQDKGGWGWITYCW